MPFIVQEIQTANDVSSFLPPEQYTTLKEAESAFYIKCGSACISAIPIHTVMVYREDGAPLADLTKCFKHGVD